MVQEPMVQLAQPLPRAAHDVHLHQMPQALMVQQSLLVHIVQLQPWPRAAHDMSVHQTPQVLMEKHRVLAHLAHLQLWPKEAHDLHTQHMQQVLLMLTVLVLLCVPWVLQVWLCPASCAHHPTMQGHVALVRLVWQLCVFPLPAQQATRTWLVWTLQPCQLVL